MIVGIKKNGKMYGFYDRQDDSLKVEFTANSEKEAMAKFRDWESEEIMNMVLTEKKGVCDGLYKKKEDNKAKASK